MLFEDETKSLALHDCSDNSGVAAKSHFRLKLSGTNELAYRAAAAKIKRAAKLQTDITCELSRNHALVLSVIISGRFRLIHDLFNFEASAPGGHIPLDGIADLVSEHCSADRSED